MINHKIEKLSASKKIPRYTLYGDSNDNAENWFLNVEHLATRCEERGWEISPHSHPDFGQVLCVISGRGTITIEDKTIPFESPCIMLVPLDCVHGFTYEKDTDGWVITIAKYYLQQINEKLADFKTLWSKPNVSRLTRGGSEMEEFKNLIMKMQLELRNKGIGHFIATESHLISFFLNILRCSESQNIDVAKLNTAYVNLVEKFNHLIEEHYRQNIKIGDFTAILGVSVAQLRAACESINGNSPIQMLQQRKITEANRNLIFSDMTIEQIAYWLGFSSPAYFARFYKKEMGTTPAKFRQENRNNK